MAVQGNAQVFYDPVYYATPDWPRVIVTDDFDGDGDFDELWSTAMEYPYSRVWVMARLRNL